MTALVVLLSLAGGWALVQGLLWASRRWALVAARRAADEYWVVVRSGPRRAAEANCLDD